LDAESIKRKVYAQVVEQEMGSFADLDKLLTVVTEGRLSDRNRALTVLARNRGFSVADVSGFLSVSKEAVLEYCRRYREGGLKLLMFRKDPKHRQVRQGAQQAGCLLCTALPTIMGC
jgi:hypothetical protein